MSSLGADEMYKREGRVTTFLKKLETKDPFVLTNGLKVVLVDNEPLREALKNKVPVKNITLVDDKGNTYSFNKLHPPEFGGGGGGSGAGSEVTDLGESAQALYAQALFLYGNTEKDSLVKAYEKVDVSASLEELMTKLPEDWIESSRIGAKAIKDNLYIQNATFHRQSKWVQGLEKHFKNLNKQEGSIFGDINKWSPADIYMLSSKGASIPFYNATTLADFNAVMYDAIKSKDIVGISLKKMIGTASFKYYNIGEKKKKIKYKSYTVGKTGFFNAKDTFIFFEEDGQIQFRTFPSFQGEIKGTNASQGKISYGAIAPIFRTKFEVTAPEINDVKRAIKNSRQEFLKALYVMYMQLDTKDSPKLTPEVFIQKANEKDEEWLLSKFMGCAIIQLMLSVTLPRKWKSTDDPKDVLISSIITYASSQSDLSGPYAKVE